MATVPPNRGVPQVMPTLLGPGRFTVPTTAPGAIRAQQMQEAGRAVAGVGGQAAQVIEQELQRQNADMVQAAMNDVIMARTRRTVDPQDGFQAVRGGDVLALQDGKDLPTVYAGRLREDIEAIGKRLTNPAQQRMFKLQTEELLTGFQSKVIDHAGAEAVKFRLSTATGTVDTAQKVMALQWGDPDAVAQAQAAIKDQMAEVGRLQGWSRAETLSKTVEALSPGHAAVVSGALQEGRLDFARGYMERISAEMTPADRLRLQQHLKAGDAEVAGSRAADEIWAADGPGADRSAPVNLFAMEAEARKRFDGQPEKAKAAIAGLRERAQAFNSTQAEFQASNTTAVFRMLDGGASLARVRTSPQWMELPGAQQRQITLSLEQEAAARESRAAAREGRELTRLQREQALSLIQNSDAYLRYGDPEVLAGMSRAQVEALRPTFGLDGTQHLLAKWDALQKAETRLEARIDKQDFDAIADRMGLKPFDPKKNEEERRALGELQYRVETLIDQQQRQLKRPLSRDEKQQLMQRELARTVTVDTWGPWNRQASVIQLTGDDARRVMVPQQDRQQIVEALRQMYQTDPRPEFEPTEANIRRLYLTAQSPAAALIPDGN